jgi:N-acetylglucosaminyldiphosphoundecaprenol N-acetyl-beta-D-mannosaminyltransferase
MPSLTHRARPTHVEWLRLGNVPLSRVGMAEAIELVAAWRDQAPFRLVVTPNVDHVVKLQHDPALREAYEGASLSLADGAPILWAARWLGLGQVEKVSGSDLVPALCRRGAREGWRVFCVGGRSPEALRATLDAIVARYPGLILGGHCPPLGFERDAGENERLLAAIGAFGPGLLFMACGSPKSEAWMHRHRDRLGCGVGISIGAALDFLAGNARRAPRWMRRVGLEWLWRLAREPRRLARRYLWDDPRFFPLVWRWTRARRH